MSKRGMLGTTVLKVFMCTRVNTTQGPGKMRGFPEEDMQYQDGKRRGTDEDTQDGLVSHMNNDVQV